MVVVLEDWLPKESASPLALKDWEGVREVEGDATAAAGPLLLPTPPPPPPLPPPAIAFKVGVKDELPRIKVGKGEFVKLV